MACTYFDKPIIASYTDSAALLCVIQRYSISSLLWKYQLYGNLCWEHKTHTLYHCGKYDHLSYREFESESRILLHKLPKQTSYIEIKEYMDEGFYVLVPINTKLLGLTDWPFKHNVFLTGYENDSFIVYDFWLPGFTWKCKKIDCKVLFQSIDFTNVDTVQSFYVFKENKATVFDGTHKVDFKELRTLFTTTWNAARNEQYDIEKCAYGTSAYQAMCDYLTLSSTFYLADSQNFHVLYDHLNFTQHCLSVLFDEEPLVQSAIATYNDLINRANRLRTIAYKFYITKRNIGSMRELLVEEVRTIGEIEQKTINCLIGDAWRTKL